MARRGKSIYLDIESKSLNALLKAKDKPARRAAVDAINLAVRSELKVAIRKSASELKVPQKIVRKRTYNSKAKLRRPSYVVRTTTWPVNLATLGAKASKRARGLASRGLRVPGSFLGTSPSGKPRAYKRKGAARYPIEMANVEIHDVVSKHLRSMNKSALRSAMMRHYPKQLAFRRSKLGASRLAALQAKGRR